MAEEKNGNGWNEYKNMILNTLQVTNEKFDNWKKDTDEKLKCMQKQHHECKEHTNIEIEKIKVKNQVWSTIISLIVSLAISIFAGVSVYHLTQEDISKQQKMEKMVEEYIEQRTGE